MKVNPDGQLSLLNFSWPILITITILFLLFFAIKKYRYKELSLKPGPRKIIISSACILLLALVVIRTSVLSLSWNLYSHPFQFIPQLFWGGFYDFLYVDFLTLAFLLFLFVFRKFPRVQSGITYFFIVIGLFSLVAGILNIRIVEMLGKPFNYRWLYYSDFLKSTDAQTALYSNISSSYIINIIEVCAAAILSGILLVSIVELMFKKYQIRKIILTLLIYLNVGYILFGQKNVPEYKWSYNKLVNPVTAFLESVNPFTEYHE